MSITHQGNVLIIGAGASADFGLPLGGPLLSEVRDELLFQVEQMEQNLFRGGYDNNILLYTKLKRSPVGRPTDDYPIWLWLKERTEKTDSEVNIHKGEYKYFKRIAKKMTSLAKLLDEQTSETIDDFIAMNPSSAELVKMAVACVFHRILYPRESVYAAPLKNIHVRKLELKKYKPNETIYRRNWIHLLINIVRHAAYPDGFQEGQKIRIISFNYDGILESVLDSQFGNTEHNFRPWRDYIEIIHPHGWMGELPISCSNMKTTVEKWASAINVVNELEPNANVKFTREKAAQWISEADKVYMAGFALSAPNAKMLGLGSIYRKNKQQWYLHNYDGSPGLKYSAQSYERDHQLTGASKKSMQPSRIGAIEVFFEGGTKNEPMTIANWFQIGVPGEMPG